MAVGVFRAEATLVLMGKPVPDGGPPATPPDAGAGGDAASDDAGGGDTASGDAAAGN